MRLTARTAIEMSSSSYIIVLTRHLLLPISFARFLVSNVYLPQSIGLPIYTNLLQSTLLIPVFYTNLHHHFQTHG